MVHADAFLRAILDDPDDDAPRLIYADWLDEQGDGDRAEFIRAQCALARTGDDDEARPALQRRERELLRRHEGAWVGGLADFASAWTFERGFVGRVTIMTEAFLRHCRRLFALAPVRHAKLRGARRNMAALSAEPGLERLASLDLSFNSIDTVGATAFFRSPHLGGLTDLDIRWNPLGSDGVRALAESRSLAGLRRLNLERAVPAASVPVLVASPVCAQLVELSLHGNHLGMAAVRALAGSPHLGRLKVLDLGDNPLGERARVLLKERFGAEVCWF